jgi:hypothetical protein
MQIDRRLIDSLQKFRPCDGDNTTLNTLGARASICGKRFIDSCSARIATAFRHGHISSHAALPPATLPSVILLCWKRIPRSARMRRPSVEGRIRKSQRKILRTEATRPQTGALA